MAYYECKECASNGTIDALVGKCPICGSNHVKLYESEAEWVRSSGR